MIASPRCRRAPASPLRRWRPSSSCRCSIPLSMLQPGKGLRRLGRTQAPIRACGVPPWPESSIRLPQRSCCCCCSCACSAPLRPLRPKHHRIATSCQTFIRQLALDENLPASLAISLLIVGIFAMSLSATSSMLSASLWVLHYDLLPALWPILTPEGMKPGDEVIARRRTVLVGCGLCARNPPGGCRRYAVWDEIYEQHLPCRIVCLLVCPAFVCTFDISVHPPKGQRHRSGKRSLGSSYCRRRCCQRYRSRDRLSGDWSRAMAVGRGSCLCGIRTCALRPRSALLQAVRRRMR